MKNLLLKEGLRFFRMQSREIEENEGKKRIKESR